MPFATTVKVTFCPALTVCETGCVMMVGATFTVTVAELEVAEPAVLVATAS